MLLSIIVPTYNCRDYLEEGLGSILCQLPQDCELIVVDDGSDDGTADMVKAYDGRQENLVVRLCEHRGASGARNTGLDMARGAYVTFMDCDDCMIDGTVGMYCRHLKGEADLYIYGYVREYLSGETTDLMPGDHFYDNLSDFADEIIHGYNKLIYSNCNKLYKKRIIDELSLRFEQKTGFGEDRLFNFTYLPVCKNVETHSVATFRYIERSKDSMSTRPVPDYMNLIKRLHEEKMNCYLSLSHGTTQEEKERYRTQDWEKEMNCRSASA